MRTGVLIPQLSSNIKYDTWVKVYDTTLTEAATSLTISGLDGDTAKEFMLEARIVNGYNGASSYYLRPNNDSGTNYGNQFLYGENSTAGAARYTNHTGLYTGASSSLSEVFQSFTIIQAKSGFIRTAINNTTYGITGTTILDVSMRGSSWNNTADNITSLVVLADQTGGLGVGSEITLWQRNYAS